MLRSFFSSFFMLIVGVGCAFLTHLILAKSLGADQYGVFSFIFSVSLVTGVFALFGFQNSSVKIVSIFQNEKAEENQTRQFKKFTTLFTVSMALLSALVVYGALYLFGFSDKYPLHSFAIGVMLTPLMVLVRLNAAFMRGFSKAALSVVYETTLREVLFVGLLLGALAIGTQLSEGVQALWLLLISLLLVALISWGHVLAYVRKTPKASSKLSSVTIKEWVTTSFPMMLVIFCQRLLRRSDIIVLGLMVHPMMVGAYAIAAQFSEVGSIGQKGIFSVFAPKAAQLHKAEEGEELKAVYTKMQLWGVVTTGGVCLCIALLSPFVMEFLGEGYQTAYIALLVLLVGQFVNVCFGPVGMLMLMTGYEKASMNLTFITALGNVLLNPMVIYFYGLEGAALTTSFFLILRGGLCYFEMKKHRLL